MGGWDDHLADRPKRYSGKFEMRPGERNADDSDGKKDRREHVAEREPPSGEHEPDQIADKAE